MRYLLFSLLILISLQVHAEEKVVVRSDKSYVILFYKYANPGGKDHCIAMNGEYLMYYGEFPLQVATPIGINVNSTVKEAMLMGIKQSGRKQPIPTELQDSYTDKDRCDREGVEYKDFAGNLGKNYHKLQPQKKSRSETLKYIPSNTAE